MAHQLIFTSLPRTLIGGSGYGIAAHTPNLPKILVEEITRLAGYTEIYTGANPDKTWNPINYFHTKVGNWHILGRISHAENDYSGRSNYLGQFLVLEPSELAACGPVSLLLHFPFLRKFEGEARLLLPCVLPRVALSASKECHLWTESTGDAGWAGVLADRMRTNQPAFMLYGKALHGTKSLALLGEALALLPSEEQWGITFCTHQDGFPKANTTRVRLLQEGGPGTRDFRALADCLDLTLEKRGRAPFGAMTEFARTGTPPANGIPRKATTSQLMAEATDIEPEFLGAQISAYQPPAPPRRRMDPAPPPWNPMGGANPFQSLAEYEKGTTPQRVGNKKTPVLLGCLALIGALACGLAGGFLIQQLPLGEKDRELAQLRSEIPQLEKVKSGLANEKAGTETPLKNNAKELTGKDAKPEVLDNLKNEMKKAQDDVETISRQMEKELADKDTEIAKLRTDLMTQGNKKTPLDILKNEDVCDESFRDTVNKLTNVAIKKLFQDKLDEFKTKRNTQLEPEKIIENTKKNISDNFIIKSDIIFPNTSLKGPENKPKLTSSYSPDTVPAGSFLETILQKSPPEKGKIPDAFSQLGKMAVDPKKNLFWLVNNQPRPEIPASALRHTLLNRFINNLDLLKEAFEKCKNDIPDDVDKKNIAAFLATIQTFKELRDQINPPPPLKTAEPPKK